jgi:hypothetical protein
MTQIAGIHGSSLMRGKIDKPSAQAIDSSYLRIDSIGASGRRAGDKDW